MTDLTKLSAPKLRELARQTRLRWGEVLDAALAAGMGSCTLRDIEEIAKGDTLVSKTRIAQDYVAARQEWVRVQDELDARKDFHGSDRPIRKPKL